jgi:ABC-type Fe2+-enterobactin transport system substrate-binding protein
VRLLDDLNGGSLLDVLGRFDGAEPQVAEKFLQMTAALESAANEITLPRTVLRQSPNISPSQAAKIVRCSQAQGERIGSGGSCTGSETSEGAWSI